MFTYNSVGEIYAAIDETRARLRAALEGLGDEGEAARDAPGRWSVAEIVEHLAIIEERVGELARRVVTKAESDGARRDGKPFAAVELGAAVERSSREKYEAPEVAVPQGGAKVSDSLARLGESRAALHALRPRIEALDLTSYRYPHPAFGPLDLYHLLAFVGVHEERHRRQIEAAIKDAPAA